MRCDRFGAHRALSEEDRCRHHTDGNDQRARFFRDPDMTLLHMFKVAVACSAALTPCVMDVF